MMQRLVDDYDYDEPLMIVKKQCTISTMDFSIVPYNSKKHRHGANSCYNAAWTYAIRNIQAFRDCPNIKQKTTIELMRSAKSVHTQMFVAEYKDTVVGTCSVELLNGPDGSLICYCDHMSVLPLAQNQGISKALHLKRIEWARQKGCTKLKLFVYVDNVPALISCQKLGYVLVESVIEQNDMEDQNELPWHTFELKL
jgi:GNAT superfamily N-acetyltransferase